MPLMVADDAVWSNLKHHFIGNGTTGLPAARTKIDAIILCILHVLLKCHAPLQSQPLFTGSDE